MRLGRVTMRRFLLSPERLLVVGALLIVAVVFLNVSSRNPPGFYRDESAIAYNAYTLSTSGRDEYGARTPLFIKSFGDYKSPAYVYLLAGVYAVTGPSTEAARWLSAVLGLGTILVLYLLAARISRQPLLGVAVAILAGLSPWLFEISRLVFEVALEPVLIALFLLVLFRATTLAWRRRDSVLMGLLLGALAYTYQVGRVLAPLYAIGLAVLFGRARRRQAMLTIGAFAATIVPIGIYSLVHPGATAARFRSVTYIHSGVPWWDIAHRFVVNYFENLNPWAWAIHGDPNTRHHVPGAGGLFVIEVLLSLAGMVVVLLRRRSNPWWRFVLYGVVTSPIACSLTTSTTHSLRMIALPVFIPLLAIPALELIPGLPRAELRVVTVAALVLAFAVEAVHWQVVYSRRGPDREDAFEAGFRPVFDAARRHGGTIYASRDDHASYIDALFYGAIAGRSRSSLVILDSGAEPPPNAVVVGRVGDCQACTMLAENDSFESYVTAR
jgi:4-amino-4-deoxy-L-arabinose transferase-like glycosyltransferase